MIRSAVSTPHAPAAIGPYSQGVRAGNLLFCSGQIPLDPATGQLVEGDLEAQTRRVMENLKAVLQAAGTSLERVVKTVIFLVTMDDFAEVNRVYGEYLPDPPPARSTVAVAGLPRGARLEVEVVALVD